DKKEIKEIIIEIKKVLTESEYYERVKGQSGNIHYPYISWVSDHKVKKDFIASERAGYRKKGEEILPNLCEKFKKNEKIDLPKNISLSKLVEKIGLEKLNFEYGEKYNFLIVRDKKKKDNYTIWDTSKYAGFGFKNDSKAEKVKNIELLRKKKNENLESELMGLVGLPLIYTGTTDDNVSSINIVGLIYDKKENLQTIFPEHSDKIIKISNAINRREKEIKNKLVRYSLNQLGTERKSINKISPSIKSLKISILGKKVK
ncbi:18375_t:CDS:2, partial [Funneliformis geosporum]